MRLVIHLPQWVSGALMVPFRPGMPLIFSFKRRRSGAPLEVPKDDIVLKGSLPKTIILLHGLTGTPNEMRSLAFYFNKGGYSVVCPRLARHGLPLDDLKHVTWEEIYEGLRGVFMQALETGDRVYVGGLSMSALFVLMLAEEFGDKVAGGVCLSVSLFYQLQRLVRAVTPMLGRVNAPMLLIHPRQDDTASIKNSQFIFDRIASATKKLIILEDSYHIITADQEREKVARDMKEFLDLV